MISFVSFFRNEGFKPAHKHTLQNNDIRFTVRQSLFKNINKVLYTIVQRAC